MNSWVTILVVHLIRCLRTVEHASDRLEPRDIATVHSTYMGVIWGASRDYYLEFKRLIPKATLEAKLCDYIAEYQSEDELESIGRFLDHAYAAPEEDLNYSEAMSYMARVLEITRLRAPMQEALLDPAVDSAELESVISKGLSESRVTTVKFLNPLYCLEEMLGNTAPTPIGSQDISYFNHMCGGGLKTGEIAIVMGPAGGFKTTLAIDVACSMAEVEERALYLTYEQAYNKDSVDLPLRFAARLSRIPYSTLEGLQAMASLDEEDKEKVRKASEVSSLIRVVDRSADSDRLSDVVAIVKAYIDEFNEPPKLVIIDQLLNWVQSWLDVKEDRPKIIQLIKDLKSQICEKFKTRLVLLHQIAAAEMSKQNKLFGAGDSAEVKGLAFNADFAITMTRADESKILRAASVKARRAGSKEVIMQAEPAIYRLHNVTETYEESSTQPGKYVLKGDNNRVGTYSTGKVSQHAGQFTV